MDKLILGLLMMQRLTIYELRAIIKRYFQSMCSDSIGGIRAAVNKLLNAQMVTYTEFVERSVNKKQYSITDKGREEFAAWAQSPANVALPKNMELGKFLLMGFVPAEKRLQLINEMISRLETALSEFTVMESSINWAEAKAKAITEWRKDDEYREGRR
jgi:DNA-binding PadR family transcriptional regulator